LRNLLAFNPTVVCFHCVWFMNRRRSAGAVNLASWLSCQRTPLSITPATAR